VLGAARPPKPKPKLCWKLSAGGRLRVTLKNIRSHGSQQPPVFPSAHCRE
jgi:hypothetical protein